MTKLSPLYSPAGLSTGIPGWGGASSVRRLTDLTRLLPEGVSHTPTAPVWFTAHNDVRVWYALSTFKNYHPDDSKHSGSRRIEFSSTSTTCLM